jgi:hypothetical protein
VKSNIARELAIPAGKKLFFHTVRIITTRKDYVVIYEGYQSKKCWFNAFHDLWEEIKQHGGITGKRPGEPAGIFVPTESIFAIETMKTEVYNEDDLL